MRYRSMNGRVSIGPKFIRPSIHQAEQIEKLPVAGAAITHGREARLPHDC